MPAILTDTKLGHIVQILNLPAKVGLIIKAASSQTASLLEFQNSAGVKLSEFLSDGALRFHVSGDDINASRIIPRPGYAPNSLVLIGAGTTSTNRDVRIFDTLSVNASITTPTIFPTTVDFGSSLGDKIHLYGSSFGGSSSYGFGIQPSRIVAYLPSGASFGIRPSSATTPYSGGIDAITLGTDGCISIMTGAPPITLGDITINNTNGITWYAPDPLAYGIHRTSGTWAPPNYAQLRIAFSTGIQLDPGNNIVATSLVDIVNGGLRVKSSAAAPTLQLRAVASQTANLQEWQDSIGTGILSRIDKAGYFMTKKTAAPADADIGASELALWFGNAAGFPPTARFKAKDAGGYVSNITVASTDYVQSRGENLVTNGSGLMGNNTNFSAFIWDSIEVFSGAGSFRKNVSGGIATNDELIPVDPSATYLLSGRAKSGDVGGANFNPANIQYFGISPIDIDGYIITPFEYAKWAGSTDTTLAVALNNGDTTMTLVDATGWNNATPDAWYYRSFSWWPYVNTKGYSYPNYTYTRNQSHNRVVSYQTNGTWAAGGVVGNVITLTAPWAGGSLPVGTPIRNGSSGDTYKYIAASGVIVPNSWTKYQGSIGGLDINGSQDQNKFPYGTAFIQLLFLFNYHGLADNNIRWNALEFGRQELADAAVTIPSRRSLGAGAQQAAPGNDSRFPANKLTVSTTAPVSPAVNDIWIDVS